MLAPAWICEAIDFNVTVRVPPGRWTSEVVVAAMRTWHKKYGQPPRSFDWAPSTGRAAGLLPDGPSVWELHYPRWPSAGTVAARFGSWCNGLRAAGLPARIPQHALPRRERILAARRLDAAGVSPRVIAGTLGVARSTVSTYLKGVLCAGCGGPAVTGRLCVACTPRRAPAASRDDVVRALREWVTEHGRAPAQAEWGWQAGSRSPWVREFPRWPSSSSVRTHFGTWNVALEAVEAPLRRRSRWPPELILDAIQRWGRDHDGRPPRYADFRSATERTVWPDPKTVASVFGSWTAALAAAGVAPRSGDQAILTTLSIAKPS